MFLVEGVWWPLGRRVLGDRLCQMAEVCSRPSALVRRGQAVPAPWEHVSVGTTASSSLPGPSRLPRPQLVSWTDFWDNDLP